MEKNKETTMIEKVLEAYFTFRRNLPEQGTIQEFKTTQDIQDDLSPMCPI